MPEKILIVEDNAIMRRSLVRLLEAESYAVEEATDGEDGLAKCARIDPDLVIMDVNMPRMDGIEALRHLREVSQVPVLILSVRGTRNDKVLGLDNGADDYLGKPFGANELLARVRALLRRRPPTRPELDGSAVLRLGGGNLVIDLTDGRVVRGGQLVHLTPHEARLLFTLAGKPGEVFTHQQLIEAIWGDDPAGNLQGLKLYVLYLRRKIERDPAQPCYVVTVRGSGYSLAVT
jgi:two-component system, OmpR family, KDP operon response regulator KdpE